MRRRDGPFRGEARGTLQDLTGRTATFSPKWQWNVGAEYVSDPFFGGFTASIRGESSKLWKFRFLSSMACATDSGGFFRRAKTYR